ncbi:hypothetical protein [Microcoleus sp. FACHB-SPT15]|jgi:hypothetical protein|uniref:hypothetical protein n=1 Tax=Microcoleus sp. FACHB-SPT15 TaxID=2692830 RepID=UPI001F554CE1|nr:hypothetical protein [Microcoleus sp. FACHB-SPT15]
MSSNFCVDDLDQQEALRYRPGQRVELKANPGVVDVITEYDPMMVPPIWLANDPKPRYPHELSVLVKPMIGMGWLRLSKRSSARPPVQQSRVHIAIGSR